MSKARQLADLGGDTANLEDISSVLSSGPLSNRNLIINGAMQVAQRGTSAVTINTTTEVFRADRFRFEQGGVTANNGTIEVASDAPTGFKYSTKVTAGSSVTFDPNGWCSINYRIEGQDVEQLANGAASAQQATLSFWVKSSVAGTYSINITKYDGSTERFHVKTYTINSANTWEYKTITFDGDTVASASSWMRLYWMLGGDSGAYNATPNTWVNGSATVRGVSSQANMITTNGAIFYLTGVQLEVGDTATPFEHRSYGQELALCQRYYWKWYNGGTILFQGYTVLDADTNRRNTVVWPVEMRSSPSLTVSWNSGNQGIQYVSKQSGQVYVSGVATNAEYAATQLIADAEL
jgi:hypothetical protein